MTDTIIDLWPDDLVPTEMDAPVRLLKQQASLLGQKMHNVVTGDVTTMHVHNGKSPRLVHTFSIAAPSLGDYKYSLFYVEHSVAPFYPLEMWSGTDRTIKKCENEEEFMRKLREVFASEETRQVISALVAQTKS